MTKTTGSILLVDDETKIRDALAPGARARRGTRSWRSAARARRSGCSTRGSFDVLLVDNLMPELTGLT